MALPKIKEARELGEAELGSQILAVKRQLLQFRLQTATGRAPQPHEIKHVKHRLSQLLTVEREREIAAAKSSTVS
jgi:large subunit ribosomal protein L29